MKNTARRFLPVRGALNPEWPRIVVCTWNILADKYSKWLGHCKQECLDWSARGPRILQELLSWGADIICLQEVERPFLDGELRAFMQEQGYEALFQPRPLRPPSEGQACPSQAGCEEGVALLYRSARLQLLASKTVRLGELVRAEQQGEFWERVRGLREGVIWALLHDQQAGRTLLAGCTHLYWQWPDCQVAQVHQLCQAGLELLRQAGLQPASTPVVLGGDFNSLPPLEVCCAATPARPPEVHKSRGGVYQLLSQGVLAPEHPEHPAQRYPGLAQEDFTTCGLQLRSVMAAAWGHEPPYTSKAPNITGCLDYLWASPHWEPEAALELPCCCGTGPGGGEAQAADSRGRSPSDAEAGVGGVVGASQYGGGPEVEGVEGHSFLPCEDFPSDHLALGARLVLEGGG